MPKLKTRRTVAKRFNLTGTGKLSRSRATMTHGLGKKAQDRKRRNRKNTILDVTNVQQIERLLNI